MLRRLESSCFVKLKPEHEQHALVDDDHLVVIPHEVVGGARDGEAQLEQTQLELAQRLLTGPIGLRDQGVHGDPARHCVAQRLLDLRQVAPEDRHALRTPSPCAERTRPGRDRRSGAR